MKYILSFILLLSISLASRAEGDPEKTFLVLFNKSELKKINSSTEFIELNFFDQYNTESYSGNSDAAILITVPSSNMDECEMGESLVQVNHSTWIPLREIAFRIIDLTESKANYHALLKEKDGGLLPKAKNQLVRLKL